MSQQKTYQSVPCQDWLMCKKKGVLCWTILRIKQSSCDRFTIIALKGQQTISRNWCWRSRYHQATVESTQNWYNLVLSSVLFNSSFFFLSFYFRIASLYLVIYYLLQWNWLKNVPRKSDESIDENLDSTDANCDEIFPRWLSMVFVILGFPWVQLTFNRF